MRNVALTDDADDLGLDDGLAQLGVDGVARDGLLAVERRHGHREVGRRHPTAAGTRGLRGQSGEILTLEWQCRRALSHFTTGRSMRSWKRFCSC